MKIYVFCDLPFFIVLHIEHCFCTSPESAQAIYGSPLVKYWTQKITQFKLRLFLISCGVSKCTFPAVARLWRPYCLLLLIFDVCVCVFVVVFIVHNNRSARATKLNYVLPEYAIDFYVANLFGFVSSTCKRYNIYKWM